MVQASVGFQCPECARSGRQKVYQGAAALAPARPIVTQVLIAINVAVFLVGLGMRNDELLLRGGLIGFAVDDGEWYRIITSGFLHFDVLHLGFNMFMLWLLGSMLEPSIGKWSFLTIYLMSLVAGSLGVLIIGPGEFTVGASGAIFGLMGAAVVGQKAVGISPWQSGIGMLLAINLGITFLVEDISIGGHIGGLLGGVAAGYILVVLRRRLPSDAAAIGLCAALTALMFYACLAVAASPL
jgi:membrane associated rhomboid family serine protease